jgi:hypothetical protein
MAFWTFIWTKGKVAKFTTFSGDGGGALLRIRICSIFITIRAYYRNTINISEIVTLRRIFAFISDFEPNIFADFVC